MDTIHNRLDQYQKSDYYGFHMPGHKRNVEKYGRTLPYGIDITEIDGFDDLHHAQGMILDAQKRAARLYHARETKFLVNGSTVGILSAILGTTKKGDRILVARNCHKSVYHALFLQELEPVYLYPEYEEALGLNGEILPEQVEQALLEYPDIRAVMIVSPTYDGVVSDVKSIAEIAHRHGIPLIVDEAHGAHFGFHPYFPKNSNQLGADLVIHSVHKTLPSLTQTALLHMNGNLVERSRVELYLRMLQTSSPSYVLMASIDGCMESLEQVDDFVEYVENLKDFEDELHNLSVLKRVKTQHYDGSKIVISTRNCGISGKELKDELLQKFHLQLEMAAGEYALAMTSVGDTKEGFQRLKEALFALDQSLDPVVTERDVNLSLPKAQPVKSIREALLDSRRVWVDWEDAIGEISTEFAYLYPPGIPILVPGERITREGIEYLRIHQEMGFQIEGPEKENLLGIQKNL